MEHTGALPKAAASAAALMAVGDIIMPARSARQAFFAAKSGVKGRLRCSLTVGQRIDDLDCVDSTHVALAFRLQVVLQRQRPLDVELHRFLFGVERRAVMPRASRHRAASARVMVPGLSAETSWLVASRPITPAFFVEVEQLVAQRSKHLPAAGACCPASGRVCRASSIRPMRSTFSCVRQRAGGQ